MKKMTPELSSLFWTQFYGALNDNLFKSALVILITYQNISLFGLSTGSMVALCGGIFILPFFFISATSGQLADKLDKVWLSLRIKEAEIVIAFLGAIGLYFNWHLLMIFVLFCLGLQSTFFGPIKYSLIPEYASEDQLMFGNALVSSGTFVAILLGTILGGIFSGIHNNLWPLIILLMIIAYLGLYYAKKLPLKNPVVNKLQTGDVDWNFISATCTILKLVFKNKNIALLVLGLSWFWFMGAGLLSLIPLVAKNIFNGNESVATLMMFIFTIGMGVGPFLLDKLTKGRVFKLVIPISLVFMSLFIFDLSFVLKSASKSSFLLSLLESLDIKAFFKIDSSLRIIVDLFLLSFFGGMFTVPQFAELQRISQTHELSRIIAGNNIVNALMMVLVSLLLMILHGMKLSLSSIFAILGMLNLAMCISLLYFYRDEFNKYWRF
jgi:MFS family permease